MTLETDARQMTLVPGYRQHKLDVIATVLRIGLVPNVTPPDVESGFEIARALVGAGCTILEILNRRPGVAALFGELAVRVRSELPELALGGGTVTEPESAAQFINAGAAFIVGPNLNPGVARVCNRRGVPYIPGCGTATELSDALEAGADIVKVFPAPSLGGPDLLPALLGPFPHALLMPSGGVPTDEAGLAAYFAAGASAVSIGGPLFPKEAVRVADWDTIERRVRAVVEIIARARRI